MPLECKIGQYLEWCTDIPLLHQTRESVGFFLGGNEYVFKLIHAEIDYSQEIMLYLELKNNQSNYEVNSILNDENHLESGEENADGHAICQIKFKKANKLLAVKTFTVSEHQQIWHEYLYNIKEKLPPDYVVGNCLKFLFFFEGVTEPLQKLSKETESKSIQTCSYLGAVTPVESLSEDLSKLLDTGVNHDAEIRCRDYSIKVHQVILGARSEVFKKMLESDMLEGRTGIVEIKDMDINYVQDFVKYLYTGALPELTFEKAKVFYEAGDKYAIRCLMLRCSDYLQENLVLTNVFQSFALADAHSDQKLKDRIKSYMLEKKLYLQDELWLPFSESFPKVALEVYRLSYKRKISEVEDQ